MFRLRQVSSTNISPATFSEEAEEQIIDGLLNLSLFNRPGLQRRLACYPYANINSKNRLIIDLMSELWPVKAGRNLFSIFNDFEIFLIGSKKRGHFIHQFEVFLLGLNFINIIIRLKKENIDGIFGRKEIEKIFEIWLLTATTHDFGYPLQEATSIIKNLSNLYGNLGMQSVVAQLNSMQNEDTLLKEIESLHVPAGERDVTQTENQIVHSMIIDAIKDTLNITAEEAKQVKSVLIEEKRHGYVSAVLLCRNLVEQWCVIEKQRKLHFC
jgi:hypothetical protein